MMDWAFCFCFGSKNTILIGHRQCSSLPITLANLIQNDNTPFGKYIQNPVLFYALSIWPHIFTEGLWKCGVNRESGLFGGPKMVCLSSKTNSGRLWGYKKRKRGSKGKWLPPPDKPGGNQGVQCTVLTAQSQQIWMVISFSSSEGVSPDLVTWEMLSWDIKQKETCTNWN